MHKFFSLFLMAVMLILAAACSSTEKNQTNAISLQSPAIVSAEQEEIDSAGMIPSDCETLFQKSQEWKYTPGHPWKPENKEQALEATRFFSTFTLVPKLSSKRFRVWLNDSSGNSAQRMEKFSQIQTCDPFLVSNFVLALIQYPWSKEDREEARKNIRAFLHNQIPITAPLLSLATTVQLMDKAYQKRILQIHDAKAFLRIHDQIKKEVAKNEELYGQENIPDGQEKLIRAEFSKSEKFRSDLSRLLPLP